MDAPDDLTNAARIAQAARVPLPGESIPITVALRLTFAPWLLEALAEQSRRDGCGLEAVILRVLGERFSSD
jgi:hypothetical protein